MSDKKRAALYARFSSDNQRSESIDAQIRAMKKYCNDNDWEIVAIYVDEAKSATTDRRINFQKMITDSSKNMFDIVLVHKLDRFSRNRYDSVIYKSKLKKNDIKLCSVLERLDDSPESIILESMLEGMAEYYSKNLGREVMKGMNETALQCKHTGGICPLGYDLDDDKRLIINHHEADAVRLIFSMYISGYGNKAIADFLNEKGYRTKKGKEFSQYSFFDILDNEKYTGVYVFNKTAPKGYNNKRNNHKRKSDEEIIRIENGCPAIISKEMFQKAKDRRTFNRQHRGQFGCEHLYLCSGKVICGHCMKIMHGAIRYAKEPYHTYICKTHKNNCINLKEIDSDKLDAYVIELLKKRIFTIDKLKKLSAQQHTEVDSDSLISTFNNTPHNEFAFRTFLCRYIKEITIYRDNVTFALNVSLDYSKEIIKTYTAARNKFSTPGQQVKHFGDRM